MVIPDTPAELPLRAGVWRNETVLLDGRDTQCVCVGVCV